MSFIDNIKNKKNNKNAEIQEEIKKLEAELKQKEDIKINKLFHPIKSSKNSKEKENLQTSINVLKRKKHLNKYAWIYVVSLLVIIVAIMSIVLVNNKPAKDALKVLENIKDSVLIKSIENIETTFDWNESEAMAILCDSNACSDDYNINLYVFNNSGDADIFVELLEEGKKDNVVEISKETELSEEFVSNNINIDTVLNNTYKVSNIVLTYSNNANKMEINKITEYLLNNYNKNSSKYSNEEYIKLLAERKESVLDKYFNSLIISPSIDHIDSEFNSTLKEALSKLTNNSIDESNYIQEYNSANEAKKLIDKYNDSIRFKDKCDEINKTADTIIDSCKNISASQLEEATAITNNALSLYTESSINNALDRVKDLRGSSTIDSSSFNALISKLNNALEDIEWLNEPKIDNISNNSKAYYVNVNDHGYYLIVDESRGYVYQWSDYKDSVDIERVPIVSGNLANGLIARYSYNTIVYEETIIGTDASIEWTDFSGNVYKCNSTTLKKAINAMGKRSIYRETSEYIPAV